MNPALALAAVFPLLTALALAVQAPAGQQRHVADAAPATEPLTSMSIACPAAVPGGESVALASASTAPKATGTVTSRTVTSRIGDSDRDTPVKLTPGGYAEVAAPSGSAVVRGAGDMAPGLFGARFGSGGMPAAGECVAPAGERWFVGVGASGTHASRLQLVNPDAGPAVADVTLWSTEGQLEEVKSRGLTIPGGTSTQLDLSSTVPKRHELAMRVSVSRGRVAASVSDTYTFQGDDPTTDWMAATGKPARSLIVPGLARKADERTLVLVNPGDSEGRVDVKVVGSRSTFAPKGLSAIRVPAGRVVITDLTKSLAAALADEDASLLLTSTVPVAASLRSVVSGDLVHNAAVPPKTGGTATLVSKRGESTLVLTPSGTAGNISVTFVGPKGETKKLQLQLGITKAIAIPDGTVAVVVHSARPLAGAVRTVRSEGASVLPLRPLLTVQLIPAVRPLWPRPAR